MEDEVEREDHRRAGDVQSQATPADAVDDAVATAAAAGAATSTASAATVASSADGERTRGEREGRHTESDHSRGFPQSRGDLVGHECDFAQVWRRDYAAIQEGVPDYSYSYCSYYSYAAGSVPTLVRALLGGGANVGSIATER